MFQCALGRVSSAVVFPQESLSLSVYVDAGGRAGRKRVWGGLAAVGDNEDLWIRRKMTALATEHAASLEATGELKGGQLQLPDVVRAGRAIVTESRRICFWANWYPSPDETAAETFLRSLAQVRVAQGRQDTAFNQSRNDACVAYIKSLTPVNRWKVFSLIAHLQWLVGELRNSGVGPQLGRVHLYVDGEDLPSPEGANDLVKLMFAASLQHSGMSLRTTGRAYEEAGQQGAVRVDLNVGSAGSPGLQFVDILLQAVQRQLPGGAASWPKAS